jgi:uncharacterized tellurite resistance protein B-like protein
MGCFIAIGVFIVIAVIRGLLENNEGSGSGTPMNTFQSRINIESSDHGPLRVVQLRGMFPITRSTPVTLFVCITDETDSDSAPILTSYSQFQEMGSTGFSLKVDLGTLEMNYGFTDWSDVSAVPMDMLIPPRKGLRKLEVHVFLTQTNVRINTNCGYPDSPDGILWHESNAITYSFKDSGYLEHVEIEQKGRELSIQIAVIVAMADGHLDVTEADVIKKWVLKSIAQLDAAEQQEMKQQYTVILKTAFRSARESTLSFSSLISKLNALDEMRSKIECIELCCEVMSADNVIEPHEIQAILKVGDSLGVDKVKVQSIIDKEVLTMSQSGMTIEEISMEAMLGVDPSWSNAAIRKHLNKEFSKWNGRISTLSGSERDSAQMMLNRIAEARKKYSG